MGGFFYKSKKEKTTRASTDIPENKVSLESLKTGFLSFWNNFDSFSKAAIVSIVVASLLFLIALSAAKIMSIVFSVLQLAGFTIVLILHKEKNNNTQKWLKYLIFALAIILTIPNVSSFSELNSGKAETVIIESAVNVKTPYSSYDCIGKDKDSVKNDFSLTGFCNISEETIDDLDVSETDKYGIVEFVSINGITDFDGNKEFANSAKVIIKYHSYKRVAVPFSSEEIKSMETEAVLKAFADIGFASIATDEIYDLDPDVVKSEFENRISVDATDSFEKGKEFPLNANIKLTTHRPFEKHTLNLIIDFVPNLIFSKYDVEVEIDGNTETINHGNDAEFEYRLKEGKYTLTFTSVESSSVKGEVEIDLTSDTKATYKISCFNDKINVETVPDEKADNAEKNQSTTPTTSIDTDTSDNKNETPESTEHIHSWESANCANPKTCSLCGETEGASLGHNYSNGKCTRCNQKDPNYQNVEMVWIPTNGGTKYHRKSSCSKMINPEQVTKSEAESRGFSPCGRCY